MDTNVVPMMLDIIIRISAFEKRNIVVDINSNYIEGRGERGKFSHATKISEIQLQSILSQSYRVKYLVFILKRADRDLTLIYLNSKLVP